jgi:hypothetical protein
MQILVTTISKQASYNKNNSNISQQMQITGIYEKLKNDLIQDGKPSNTREPFSNFNKHVRKKKRKNTP